MESNTFSWLVVCLEPDKIPLLCSNKDNHLGGFHLIALNNLYTNTVCRTYIAIYKNKIVVLENCLVTTIA